MRSNRIHISDLPFKSYFMLYRASPYRLRKIRENGSSRRLYRDYKFLIELLNEEDSYSHNVEELYDRLVELSRDPDTLKNKKLSLKIAKLLNPAEFMMTLAFLVEHKLIFLEISRFTKDRVIQGSYEGTYSSRTGWCPDGVD